MYLRSYKAVLFTYECSDILIGATFGVVFHEVGLDRLQVMKKLSRPGTCVAKFD